MPDLKYIYANEADRYQQLVAREDYQHNLLRAIEQICPGDALDIVETGAGTGRLTCLLAPKAKSIRLFDESQAMLDVAAERLQTGGWSHWRVGVADHLSLPVEDASADLSISGWSLCYAALDHPTDWQNSTSHALNEMERVLRPGGTIIVIETQGTGAETPNPPAILHNYLDFLSSSGMQSTWIRTDFLFESVEEAASLMDFFFGPALAEKVRQDNQVIIPECTGIWWKKLPLY